MTDTKDLIDSSRGPHRMYSIDRGELAQMVAAHTCGIADAIPGQDDFDAADEMLAVLERRLDRY